MTTCPGEATTSQVTFGCLIAGYFPEPVTVSWNPGATSTGVTTYPAMMSSSSLYSLSSQLTVPASSWESTTYRCDVQHQPTSTSISKEIPKAKSHAPEVHVFHSSCRTDSEVASINLLCIISGFYPQNLTVTWLVDGQPEPRMGVTYPTKKDSGSKTFSTHNVANVSQESFMEGKRYTCHVYHPGSDTEIEDHTQKCKSHAERCRSARGGDTQALPSTEETLSSSNIHVFMVPPSAAELYVNQYPKLTCLVVSLPSNTGLGVVWSREKPGSMSSEPPILQEQSNGTFTAFSSLPIQTRDWESGETYTCKVEHPDLSSPIIKTITRKPGKRSAPGVYLLDPHPDELSSGKDSVSLTCVVRGFFPEDISVQWMKNHKADTSLEYSTTSPMKEGIGDSTFFLYSMLNVNKSSWNSGTFYTCMVVHEALPQKFTQRTISKASEVILSGEFCSEEGDEELKGLWSTISVFITLFLLSVCYSATVTLFKVKWIFSTVLQLKQESGPDYKNVVQSVVDSPIWSMYMAEGHCWHMMADITLVEVHVNELLMVCADVVRTISPKAPSVFPLTSCPGEATTSQVTFGCLIAGYFPEPVTVSWNPGATSTSVTTYPAMMSSSGLYSLSSQLTVPASSWESATYRCNVQHQPTSTSISKEIPKAKSHAPEVHVFHSSCRTDSEEASINLLCIISGFYPQTLTVTWLVNGQSGVLSGVTDRPKLDSDSKTFSTRSVATVSQESFMEGKRYTCHVYHPGSDTEIEDHARKCKSDAERCRSARGGDTQALPSTEETLSSSNIHVFMVPPSAAELYVNQYPKLTCLVVSLPSDTGLGVIWSREKPGSISPEPTILQEQSNGTFTAFSSLPIQTRDWENGETYTCKVEHSDLPSPIIKTITRKPGKRSAPGVYLLDPHPDELSSGKDSISLTCIVRGFFPEDISVQWMKNHKADTSLEYSTTSPMKEGKGDSTFFLYSNLNVNRSSWNSGTFYTCMVVHEALPQKFTQRTISKASEVILSGEFCSEEGDEELKGLWSTISVFITLFLLSVCYSATVTLFKVKWIFSTVVQLKQESSPDYKNVVQSVV
ncbi:uncharacterized protein [Emydura macquarii macquarii]|uniref:uncharacterized protein n=1 Tax=Emydura macquarii macquarii TaxID=1129001 RepID=UPI00352A0313